MTADHDVTRKNISAVYPVRCIHIHNYTTNMNVKFVLILALTSNARTEICIVRVGNFGQKKGLIITNFEESMCAITIYFLLLYSIKPERTEGTQDKTIKCRP